MPFDARRTLTPEQHQTEQQQLATDAIVRELQARRPRRAPGRARIHMACGAGKTRIGPMVASALKTRSVLVLVPSKELVAKMASEWTRAGFRARAWCSGSEVVLFGQQGASDEVFACKKDPAALQNAEVVICTYQSAADLEEYQRDLVVYDEAHRADNERFGEPLDWPHIRWHVLMSATTSRIEDNDDRFGREVFRLTFAEAVELGIVKPLRIRIEHSASKSHETDTLDWSKRLFRKGIRDGSITKAISFHARVSAAKEFSEMFPRSQARFVSGNQDKDERRENMREFDTGKVNLIANVACLTEGVDIPRVDAVFFTCPRRKEGAVVQAAGRASRRAPNKEYGYLYLPLCTGKAGVQSIDDVQATGGFKQTVELLRHLISSGQLRNEAVEAVLAGEEHPDLQIDVPGIDRRTLAKQLVRRAQGEDVDFYDRCKAIYDEHARTGQWPGGQTADARFLSTCRLRRRGRSVSGRWTEYHESVWNQFALDRAPRRSQRIVGKKAKMRLMPPIERTLKNSELSLLKEILSDRQLLAVTEVLKGGVVRASATIGISRQGVRHLLLGRPAHATGRKRTGACSKMRDSDKPELLKLENEIQYIFLYARRKHTTPENIASHPIRGEDK